MNHFLLSASLAKAGAQGDLQEVGLAPLLDPGLRRGDGWGVGRAVQIWNQPRDSL